MKQETPSGSQMCTRASPSLVARGLAASVDATVISVAVYLGSSIYLNSGLPASARLASFCSTAAALLGYGPLLEASRLQATFGKWLLGIKVQSSTGGRIGLARATARFLSKYSMFMLTLGISMATSLLSSRRTMLHDLVCKTRVVKRTVVDPTDGLR